MRLKKISIATAIVVAMLQSATPSHAAGHNTDPIAAVGDMLGAVRDFLMSPFTGVGKPAIRPPTPMDLIHGAQTGSPFWEHLADAGYTLKEVTTDVGLIPGLEFEFVLVRELSEADRDALERKLEIATKRNRNVTNMIQRQIVRTLLEASDFEEIRIAEVFVSILPLPSVTFKAEPAEGPLGEEHDAIYRAVQGLRHEMKDRTGKP